MPSIGGDGAPDRKSALFGFRDYSVFEISRMFGLFPYRMDKGQFQISLFCCFHSIFVLFFLCSYATYHIWYFFFLKSEGEEMGTFKEKVADHCMLTFNVILFISSSLTSVSRAPPINRILKGLDDLDLHQSKSWQCWRPSRRHSISWKSICCGLMVATSFAYGRMDSLTSSADQLFHLHLTAVTWLAASQFSSLGYALSGTLKKTTFFMKNLPREENSYKRRMRTSNIPTIYNRICDMCSRLDAAFMKLQPLQLFVSFLTIVINVFVVYRSIWNRQIAFYEYLLPIYHDANTKFGDIHPMQRILRVLISISSIYQLVDAPGVINEEMEEFNESLHQLILDRSTQEVVDNDKILLHCLMKREVTFSAWGLFQLEYGLIHGVIAGATTYLIILLQLE